MSKSDQTAKNWRNQAAGQAFEDEIITLSGFTPGLMLIRQYPGVRFFSGGRAEVIAEAWPDFVLFYNHFPFIFDAKTTQEKKVFRPSTKSKHQFFRLVETAGNGIGAFYLVNWLEYDLIELFKVNEADQWPVKYEVTKGEFYASRYEGNWLQVFADNYFSIFYKGK